MYLDYSKLEFDVNGLPETPQLMLKTLGDKMVGIIPGVHNLKLNIKFSEPSEISFDIPAVIDGEPNPLYDDVTGYKQIYTKCYGVYETMNPETEADGIMEVKHVKGYSYEKTLESKKLFLEEGTFNFWNPGSPTDTVLGRILEVAIGWSVGYVSPSLIGKYRTFDQYDDYLLSFMYNHAPEKYRCVFVFDTYKKTINVYDADEERPTLPIYLDFDNLIESLGIEEKSDELVTAIRPYGSDELSIRDVNPIGTNWIYDLSYFIANGDIREPLASKWVSWQRSILNRQAYYRGLTGLRASSTARLLTAQTTLADLKGELETLTAQQSVTIQAHAMEITSAGKAYQQSLLNDINKKIAAKTNEVKAQEDTIASIEQELDPSIPSSYAGQIQAIAKELSITNYFTEAEYRELSNFLIEQDITEDTFVATDVDTTISGQFYPLSNNRLTVSGSAISGIDLNTQFGKKMYTMSGGTFSLSGSNAISGDIIRGTLEVGGNSYVLSFYAGTLCVNNKTAASGMVTMSGTLSGFSTNVSPTTTRYPTDLGEDIYITTDEGTAFSFNASGSMYLTANVSDYQRYSVEMELYEWAVDTLDDVATPTYEFSVDSANFIFAQEFAPFRNQLELGKGVYLNVGGRRGKYMITPYIIEFELDFEERNQFSIVFSNRFKRHDNVNTLKDMIESSYSTSRSFDASKYIYNQTVGQASMVSKFMSDSLDAAKNTILAAANQSVIINGAGIHVGGDSKYQIRIVDSMIAMSDDNWGTCKLAIGHFASPEIGEYFGVNAEVIGGKLIVGNNLIIENTNDRGVMQFRVDATGAWLYNATFILQSGNASAFSARAVTGGKIILDPDYGIVAGRGNLFTTSGTTVTPSFINSSGNIMFDSDGMPVNSNFFLDIRDGSAYFRGAVKATSGKIGGFTIADDYLYAGSGSNYVAMNGSGTNNNSLYAFWAGAANPASAPFWVKKNGDIYAKNGTFKGVVSGASFQDRYGNSMMNGNYEFTADYLNLNGLNVGNGNFVVDRSGNVSVRGSITMAWGSSINWANVSESNAWQSSAYQYADSAYSRADSAYRYADDAYELAWDAFREAQDMAVTDREIFNILTNNGTLFGIFSDSTNNRLYINANYIRAGTIDASQVTLSNSYGGFCCARGHDGIRYTYGSMIYGSDPSNYVIVTNAGARMTAGGNDILVTAGGCYSSEEMSRSSDRRVKNSITYDMERYSDFFLSLRPTPYRMNNGRSGRFHLGFVAQDIEEELINAGMTTNDFAGFVRSAGLNDVHGAHEDQCYLRYENFIALNTYMIQKLYHTVDEFNSRIAELESKLNFMS